MLGFFPLFSLKASGEGEQSAGMAIDEQSRLLPIFKQEAQGQTSGGSCMPCERSELGGDGAPLGLRQPRAF